MKKIALIKKDFHVTGGLEKSTSSILNALLKKGADVSLFTTSPQSMPCPSYSYQPKGMLKVQKLRDFDRWLTTQLSSSPFEVVFSMDRCSFQTHHRAGNGVHAAYLDVRSKFEGYLKKLSFSLNPLHRLHLQLERHIFKSLQTKVIIVNSAMVKKQIIHYYNTPPSKIHVINNGVEWKELQYHFNDSITYRTKYMTDLGLDPSVFQFLFVGHNFERKGLKILLKALSLLPNKNFHLSIVGDDREASSYQLLTEQLQLHRLVTFFGAKPSILPFYLAADALVIPSLYDPFANVTVEALALGLFVISSKMNGGHEILYPSSGIIVENPHDVEELSFALKIALNHPKEMARGTYIRSTVAHLDYPLQLEKICQLCLG